MAAEGEVVKRKLHELRVIDLKAELEKRGLDKTGVKAVLMERMQQALQKDGHDYDDYLFEVTEVTPVKKPSKRTNKKLARDDESETHSNVDESQNDLVLDDDEKMDSDDDRIDEKFFQVLETTDGGEDAIDISIEEGDKLLIDEDYVASGEKEEQVDIADEKKKKDCSGDDSRKSEGTVSNSSPRHENVSTNASKVKCTAETDGTSNSKGEDHGSLIVHVEEAQRDLDSEMAATGQATSSEKENVTNGEPESDSKKESGCTKKPSEEGQKKGDSKSTSIPEKASATSKGGESGNNEKTKTPASDKGETKSPVKGGKQEEDKTAVSATNKAKSTVANAKDGKSAVERAKTTRPAISAKNLWVTGLSSTTRATDLKALFSKHGKVIGAKIVSNARSSVSRCYGFVTMATVEEASKCIQYLHRTELHGRMISVERAKAEPVGPNRRKDLKAVVPAKKVPDKKEPAASIKDADTTEKKADENTIECITDLENEKKDKEEEKVPDKVSSEKKENAEIKAEGSQKEKVASAENAQEDKSPKKDDDKGKRESHRHRNTSSSRRSSSDRTSRDGGHTHYHFRRVPTMSGFRRPFYRRPAMRDHHSTLTFNRIRAERIRQRQREEEREMRESERRRRQDVIRQREIERKQREEAVRLERERERLRIERERLERERAEVLRLEREKQRLERERIEREREELRRRERLSRVDDHRRPVKRTFDNYRGGRDSSDFDDRKRPFVPNSSRRDSTIHDRGSRSERFERGNLPRDTDLRGHSRDDRGISFRDGSDSIGQSRPTPKDDWKTPQDRRGHHGVNRDRNDRFDSGKGMSGNVNYVVDRGGGSWHGGVSQSDSRGSGSKPYSSGGGMQSRDNWGSDRKSDGQSWGRSDGGQGDRWGGGMSGGSGGRNQQSLNMGQSLLSQPPSTMFDSTSGGGSGNMVGMGTGGSSYGSDRFDAYKGMNNMRRF